MSNTRFSVYKNGYVQENGDILEPLYISSGNNEMSAFKKSKVTNLNKHNYHVVQEQFDGLYWVSIEGTEKHF